MRGIDVILVLLAVVLCSSLEILATDPPTCPPEDPSLPPAYFPNPDDNTTFYICSWGVPILHHCPEGLVWNSDLNTCDHVTGEGTSSPQTTVGVITSTAGSSSAATITTSNPEPTSDVTTSSPTTTTSTSTPSPGTTSGVTTSDPGTNPNGCPAVQGPDDVLLSNPLDCGTFFKCKNGVPVLQYCPVGLEWNDDRKYCDYPERANCTATGVSTTSNPSSPVTTSNPETTVATTTVATTTVPTTTVATTTVATTTVTTSNPTSSSTVTTSSPDPNPNGCPAVNGPDDVLLPNPDNCGTFFKCDNGVPVLQYCPQGLEWNDDRKYCDFPERANCTATAATTPSPSTTGDVTSNPTTTTSTTTSTPTTTVEVTTSSTVPNPNGCPAVNGPNDVLLPNPDNCGTFFKCNNGVPVLQYCPQGLEWNDDRKYCDFPERANCTATGGSTPNPSTPVDLTTSNPTTTTSTTTSTPTTTVEVSTSSTGPNPNGCPAVNGPDDVLLPNPDNCGTFFKCDNGVPVLQYCPQGLEWNDDRKYCDFPERANCTATGGSTPNPSTPVDLTTSNPTTTTSTTTSTPTTTVEVSTSSTGPDPNGCPAVNGPDDVLLPNPDNCGTFFKCDNGVPVLQYCPQGLEWNDDRKYCDFPERANCTATGGSTPAPSTPIDVTTSNPITTTSTPITTVTTPNSETTVDVITTSPGPSPNKCPAIDGPEDVLLPNPSDCTTFFKCNHGVPVLQYCPKGLQWNDERKICDYPDTAKCIETGGQISNPSTSSGYVPTSESPSNPGQNSNTCPPTSDGDDVLLPNPADCTTFFKCAHGLPVLIYCPLGLEWNDKQKYCDYPEIAQCIPSIGSTLNPTTPVVTTSNPDTTVAVTSNPTTTVLTTTSNPTTTVAVTNPNSETTLDVTTVNPGPNLNDCPEDVLLPNSADCGTFFKYRNGGAVLQYCPSGLEWNDEIKYCDFPERAKCTVNSGSSSNPSSPVTTSNPEPTVDGTSSNPETTVDEVTTPDTCSHGTLLPNPEDCSTYIRCRSGVLVLQYCPPDLEWNDERKYCDLPERANCIATSVSTSNPTSPVTTSNPDTTVAVTTTNPPSPVTTSQPQTTVAETTSNPSSLVTTSNPETTVAVISSEPSSPVTTSNSDTTVAVTTTNPPSPVTTSQPQTTLAETTSNPETTVNVVTNPDSCPSGTLIQNPADCGSFISCVHGMPVIMDCPKGLEWNDIQKYCDYPASAQCTTSGGSSSSSTSSGVTTANPATTIGVTTANPETTTVTTSTPKTTVEVTTPSPETTIVTTTTPTTTVEVTTPSPETTTVTTTTVEVTTPSLETTIMTTTTPTTTVEVTTPSQETAIVTTTTPTTTVEVSTSNPETTTTSTPRTTVEVTTPNPQTTADVTTSTANPNPNQCPAIDGPVDVLLPNPANCRTFFKCNHGVPVLQDCPAGLEWNDAKKYCDYPHLANCQAAYAIRLNDMF